MSDQALVPSPSPQQALTVFDEFDPCLVPKVGETIPLWSTLDMTNESNKLTVINYLNDETTRLSKTGGKTIMVKDFVSCVVVAKHPETGVVGKLVKVLLIGPDGEVFHTHGVTARSCLARILAAYPPPWPTAKALSIRISSPDGVKQKYYITVVPDVVEQVEKVNGKKGGK